MKKLYIPLLILLIAVFAVNSGAVKTVSLSAENSEYLFKPGDTVEIPFNLSDNEGLMGFKVNVKYSPGVLNSPEVHRGAIIQSGNFNDSISEETNGEFSAVWNESADMKQNGEFFTLKFKVCDTAPTGDYLLSLSFSPDDTFNEAWEGIILDMHDVRIHIDGVETSMTVSENTTVSEPKETVSVSESINAVTEENTVSTTNEAVTEEKMTEEAEKTETEKTKIITQTVKDVLEEMNIPSLEDVPEEEKEEFAHRVSAAVSQKDGEEKTFSFDEISEIVEEAEQGKMPIGEQPEKDGKYVTVTTVVLAVIALIIVMAIVVMRKKNNLPA